jgi:hypothetical protein
MLSVSGDLFRCVHVGYFVPMLSSSGSNRLGHGWAKYRLSRTEPFLKILVL